MSATATLPETQTPLPEKPAEQLSREERVRMRAYELYQSRNGAPGDPDGDWFRAIADIDGKPTAEAK